MKQLLLPIFILLQILVCSCCKTPETKRITPRVIICSDINNVGGDPDDKQ